MYVFLRWASEPKHFLQNHSIQLNLLETKVPFRDAEMEDDEDMSFQSTEKE